MKEQLKMLLMNNYKMNQCLTQKDIENKIPYKNLKLIMCNQLKKE